MNLLTKIAYFLYHGLALATRSTYDSYIRSYMEACRLAGLQRRDGSLFPAELLWIENWVVELAGQVKAKDIKKHVACYVHTTSTWVMIQGCLLMSS